MPFRVSGLVNFPGAQRLLHGHRKTFLVDGLDAVGRDLESDPAALLLVPETFGAEVGVEAALALLVGVGNVVAHLGGFARDLASFHFIDNFQPDAIGSANIRYFR